MDKKQSDLAEVVIALAEARRKRLALEERNPFFCLTPEQQQAVLRLDHTPRSLGEIEGTLREALPGTEVYVNDNYIGGRGYCNYTVRIGDHSLSLVERRGSLFTVALPQGV